MKLKLQFFGEEDIDAVDVETPSVEESEVAEQTEVEETDVSETEETDEGTESKVEEKPIDVNAIAASARRKAESEAKERQEKLDAEYARRFGKFNHPVTGKPISTQAEYLDALDAQERIKAERTLKDKGVDPNFINALIENNPDVVKAREVIKQMEQMKAMEEINAHVAELSQIDPSITKFEDVPKDIVDMAIQKNITLTEAYKIANYGKTTSQKAEAIRQSAVNQAKGKAHLNPMNGVATSDNSVEIPSNLRSMWEEAFPDKSYSELKKMYNEQL